MWGPPSQEEVTRDAKKKTKKKRSGNGGGEKCDSIRARSWKKRRTRKIQTAFHGRGVLVKVGASSLRKKKGILVL